MKELNLVEILKDVPEGVEFYSTTYGNVVFDKINYNNSDYPIRVITISEDGNRDFETLTSDGRFLKDFNGECTLFPSKTNRNWEGWKYNHLNEGDLVMVSHGDYGANNWHLRSYTKSNEAEIKGCQETAIYWKYIVPAKDFDFEDVESNIHKSVI